MLIIKCFKFNQEKEMNEALQKYSLASGMHIMTSNGEIIIPFEDGKPKPNAVVAVELAESNNTLQAQRDIIVHSEEVNAFQLNEIKEKIDVLRADIENATANPVRKALEKRRDMLQGNYDAIMQQMRENKHELARIDKNIELNNEKIDALTD